MESWRQFVKKRATETEFCLMTTRGAYVHMSKTRFFDALTELLSYARGMCSLPLYKRFFEVKRKYEGSC